MARASIFYEGKRFPCIGSESDGNKGSHELSPEEPATFSNLSRLPSEVMSAIFDELVARDMPRISSRLVSQKLWKDQLKAGSRGLLPWLWDVEPALIEAKDAESCPGGSEFEWDWELLIRQLSRGVDYGLCTGLPNSSRLMDHFSVENSLKDDVVFNAACTGYSTDMAYVPAGLHNRRRVWQLLEEMFVGDALPSEMTQKGDYYERRRVPVVKDCVPLWWNKSGDQILSEPIWIPSINNIDAFKRRLGGDVYILEGYAGLQYWQKPSLIAQHETSGDETETQDVHGASVEEIYSVLRPLGYPV
ncbi:hypothetical protein K456DRAFT_803206 [Colletotrichum gloeosporioides 23]|nr:hypothetical protein K456DRAFT_803206 [Colletotrichum gloeosporioides 23]